MILPCDTTTMNVLTFLNGLVSPLSEFCRIYSSKIKQWSAYYLLLSGCTKHELITVNKHSWILLNTDMKCTSPAEVYPSLEHYIFAVLISHVFAEFASRSCVNIYAHKYIHTYIIHACRHTYIHSYIHTYMNIHTWGPILV